MVNPVYKSDIKKQLSMEDIKKVTKGNSFARCSPVNMINAGVEFVCHKDNDSCENCIISKHNTKSLLIEIKKYHIKLLKSS
jgi:hypothetical protein